MAPDASPTARALLALELIQGAPASLPSGSASGSGFGARGSPLCRHPARGPHPDRFGPRAYGGYRVGRGLRLPPLTFTATEALGLVMAVLDGHHDPADPADPVGSALGKLVRALPEPVAAQAEAVRRAAAAAPDRPPPGPTRRRPPSSTPAPDQRSFGSATGPRRARMGHRGRPVGRRGPARPVVPRCAGRSGPTRPRLPGRPGRASSRSTATLRRPTASTPSRCSRSTSRSGWEYEVDVVIEAPVDRVRRRLPRALGRLDPWTTPYAATGARATRTGTPSSSRSCGLPSASTAASTCGR